MARVKERKSKVLEGWSWAVAAYWWYQKHDWNPVICELTGLETFMKYKKDAELSWQIGGICGLVSSPVSNSWLLYIKKQIT